VYKGSTGRNSVVKKRCENQLTQLMSKRYLVQQYYQAINSNEWRRFKCASSVVLNEAIPHIGYNKYNFLNIRFIPLFTASHHNAVDDL
jgi:hypothetical protein